MYLFLVHLSPIFATTRSFFQVYNVISGILSHVTQTGYNSYGQPTYSSTDQFGSPISG